MAELRDVPVVIRSVGWWGFLKKLWFEIGDDNLFTWGSALAYSWLFAIFPFFLFLLSLIPLLKPAWKLEAKHQIDVTVQQLPREAQVTIRQFIDPRINALLFEEPKGITAIWSIGLLVTIWAASGGMAMTMSAMDRCYDVQRARPIYKQRPLAVALTIVVATLILAVVVLVPIGTVVTNFLTSRTERLLVQTGMTKTASPAQKPAEVSATAPATQAATQPIAGTMLQRPAKFTFFLVLWQIARHFLGLLFLVTIVTLIYHFGPNVKQKFRMLTPGTVFTVTLWILLSIVFRIYVDTWGSYGQTYGAVGGVVILLFLFYLFALILLVGAEINSEVDCATRNFACEREKPPPPAETVDTEPAVETP